MSFDIGHAHVLLIKSAAGQPQTTHALSGELYASHSGWLLLNVPNSLVHGAFAALDEPGVELPPGKPPRGMNAHISVIRPEELEQAGLTMDDIKERGQRFRYTLGPIQSVVPHGWDEMSKVWFIKVDSPELKRLRKTYGLTPLPKNNEFDFHITVAVRRKHVLGANTVSKAASLIHGENISRNFPKLAPPPLPTLLKAKSHSEMGDYNTKYMLIRQMMQQHPEAFIVDSPTGKYHGITHVPTGFKFHVPPHVYGGLIKAASLGYSVHDSQIHGQGTFATHDYEPGDRIGLALQLNRVHEDGTREYDRTVLGRYVNYQKEGNVALQEDNGQLYLHAVRPIAEDEELYTQPYEQELEPFKPLLINQGYKQAFDMSGSWYGDAAQDYTNNLLSGHSPVWDPSQGVMGNVTQHLGKVNTIASNRINQAQSYNRFQAAVDPDFAMQQLSTFLSGQRRPLINHPVDAALYGRFGQ
jgi:hypothetical protein